MNKTNKTKIITNWREQNVWKRRKAFWHIVEDFRRMGFKVKVIDKYKYSFNESIIIDPGARTFENLRTGEKGETKGKNLNIFLREHFGLVNK